jgi:aminopeptidase N
MQLPCSVLGNHHFACLSIFRKKDVTYNDQVDSIARKIEVANLVALKTTRQWFVNVISPSQWSYFWLNDALSTWVATLVLDKVNTLI